MKSSSSITFVMDGNFSRVGGEIYSPHMGHEKFAGRFTPHFDAVRIVARAFPKVRPIGSLVTGPNTSFVDLGAIRGARLWLMCLPGTSGPSSFVHAGYSRASSPQPSVSIRQLRAVSNASALLIS